MKILAAHHEKAIGAPAAPPGQTVMANEAFSNIGAEISKAADKSKKRRLETLDREGVDRQNNDRTKRVRPEIEDEEIETMTGHSGVDVSSPPSSAEILEEETNRLVTRLDTGLKDTEDIAPPRLTPHKGNYLKSNYCMTWTMSLIIFIIIS